MADLFDYLYWRGDLSMQALPFTSADGLILSLFAFLPMEKSVGETLGETVGILLDQRALSGDTERLAKAAAESRRFGGLPLHRFEAQFSETEQMQFAAAALLTEDNRAFVAFRGTDSTLVGWKENLNMAFTDEIPAQREATVFLNRIGRELSLPLRVGGHSKGGNLAVYAAAMCEASLQRRIGCVYNFDGPGLSDTAARSEGLQGVQAKIETYLPRDSIVGILLERAQRIHVVASDAKGVQQHNPLSWRVTPDGFEELESLGKESLYAERTLRSWLERMSGSERRRFVETLYDIVSTTRAKTVGEAAQDWESTVRTMLGAFAAIGLRDKALLFRSVGRLLRAAVENLDGA